MVEKKPVEPPSADYASLLDSKHSACIQCHGDVKPFHTVDVIRLIDERKGINPRLCTVCHGQKIHNIHWASLEAERIICDTCHTYQGGFVKPKAMEGQLLVCEVCHSSGNYIKIHIEGNILEGAQIDEEWVRRGTSHQCDSCHVGEFDSIHFNPLLNWRERINATVEESTGRQVSPLNISYA